MKYINKIESILKNWEIIYKGCSTDQIKLIEKLINKKLPTCYNEFLTTMGCEMDRKDENSRGGFVGESIFYEDVFGDYTLKNGLIEQLEEDGKDDLIPKIKDNNVFVFASHQGYIFAFFKLNEGDNPPVYGYHEGQNRDFFPKLTDSLLDFFEQYLEYGKDPYNALDE